jgi:hypothetical protein
MEKIAETSHLTIWTSIMVEIISPCAISIWKMMKMLVTRRKGCFEGRWAGWWVFAAAVAALAARAIPRVPG